MKNLFTTLTILFAFLFYQNAHAQPNVLYAQNFEAYPQVNFTYPWSAVNGPNAFPWRCDVPYIVFGLGFVDFENKSKAAITASNGSNDNVLVITPSINIAGKQNVYVSYDSYFRKLTSGGKSESATVEVSTDNGVTWNIAGNAPVSALHMQRSYASLAAANSASSLRVGFRYSDSMQPQFGWIVDNIKVFVPAQNDIGLIHAQPEDSLLSYYAVPASVPLQGTVMNWGTSPITAFDVYYQEPGGAMQSYSVTGVNIAPFDTFNFTHSVPLSINSIGTHKARIWAVTAGDTTHGNDTLTATIRGAVFTPEKNLVIEEGTATWNVQAPRGYVYMHALDSAANPPTRISVHSDDTMDDKPYADYLYYMNQNFTPYFLFDRRGPVRNQSFFEAYNLQRAYFGFADMDLKGQFFGNKIEVAATVRPAVELAGSYRLAMVITEDGVSGTGPAFAQANQWAGGAMGPMGGFEMKPNPVPASAMKYDYVARSITPAPEGSAGCLPAAMHAGQSYACTLSTPFPAAWNFRNMKAIVLLIRDRDSSILNSKSAAFRALSVPAAIGSGIDATLYPNPATDAAILSYKLSGAANTSVVATDVLGRVMFEQTAALSALGAHQLIIPTRTWPEGIYVITLHAGDAFGTFKLSVLH